MIAKCPYCEGVITLAPNSPNPDAREIKRSTEGFVKKEIMYICPHCDKILGFGFFMGGLFTSRP